MSELSAQSITFRYDRDITVFQDLSLELRSGEVLVLLGANGAGKTTLLRSLAGHLHPSSGTVLLDDLPMAQWSKRDIAQRLALMPQSEHRETPLSVREMVQLGRAAHRGWWLPLNAEDFEATESALEKTCMLELAERPVTKLSGGQWRRAVLARSLAQDASILLLDEPTSGLDLRYQYECLDQVRRLVKQHNLIAVLTLHDLQQTAMFADRVALLAKQQIMAIGDCETVLNPENIEKAYGINVTVVPHPESGRPLIVPSCSLYPHPHESHSEPRSELRSASQPKVFREGQG